MANHDAPDGTTVRASDDQFLATVTAPRESFGSRAPAVAHVLKVTASYRPGLFACDDVPDLPRTNNDLEHRFGATRYLERRASGRKMASPSLVLRGSVRLSAAVVTRDHPFVGADLRPPDLARWQQLRAGPETRHHARRLQRRFRRDSATFLSSLENLLLQQVLPP